MTAAPKFTLRGAAQCRDVYAVMAGGLDPRDRPRWYQLVRLLTIDGAPCGVTIAAGDREHHRTFRSKAKAYAAAATRGAVHPELLVRDHRAPEVVGVRTFADFLGVRSALVRKSERPDTGLRAGVGISNE